MVERNYSGLRERICVAVLARMYCFRIIRRKTKPSIQPHPHSTSTVSQHSAELRQAYLVPFVFGSAVNIRISRPSYLFCVDAFMEVPRQLLLFWISGLARRRGGRRLQERDPSFGHMGLDSHSRLRGDAQGSFLSSSTRIWLSVVTRCRFDVHVRASVSIVT